MSQLKRGAILNYTTIFLTNVVGLLLTPFIIRKLGDSEYGLYILIGSFVGYISLLDFGLNNTVIRFVAKYRAEEDKKKEENFLATTPLLYTVISILVAITGTLFYFGLDGIFADSLSAEELGKAKIMFLILIFNLVIRLPGGIFEGICFGYEQFVFPKSINIVRYLVRSITVVAVLTMGGKAISMVIIDTVFNLLVILINAIFVFRKLNTKIKFHQFETSLVKHIFSYSFWIFVSALVSQFHWKAGQMVLGVVADTTAVAVLAVGIVLGSYYGAFSGAISGVFLPRATQMSVLKASGEELTDMMIKIGRISFLVLLYILMAFYLYGQQFVFLWVGDTYTDSWLIALVIMLAYTVPLVQAFGNSVLQAKNKMAFKAIVYLVFMVIGTAIGAFFAKEHGAIGMVLGSTTGWLVAQNIMNFYYHNTMNLNMLKFFRGIAKRILLVGVLVLMVGYAINYIPGEGWMNFIVKGILYSLVYVPTMYFFGMIPYEKELFNRPLKNIFRKK